MTSAEKSGTIKAGTAKVIKKGLKNLGAYVYDIGEEELPDYMIEEVIKE